MKILCAIAALTIAVPMPAVAWDGTDTESGADVEIEGGELVRSGEDIEFYDYETGEYHQGTVEDIDRTGSGVELEIYDNTTGEYRVLEMEE